jgi:hypothetical protein
MSWYTVDQLGGFFSDHIGYGPCLVHQIMEHDNF